MIIDIQILFDNYAGESKFHTGFGYSCFIKKGHGGILFDTGGDPDILLKNLKHAKIEPSKISRVVLSHSHKDHTGGLKGILKLKDNVTVYAGKSFVEALLKDEELKGVNIVSVGEEPVEIMHGVYLTGELGSDIKEISLVVDTGGGLVIATGCAHAGIENIFKRVHEIIDDEVFALIGGLHLKNKTESEILNIIDFLKKEGIKYIAPSHCTGDLARELFKKAFTSGFIEAGVGTRINIGGSCEY